MTSLAKVEATLREYALSYPETNEDFPWGERAIKVKGKGFLFMRVTKDEISLSVKLPHSRDMAADLPFTEPTHYGMGKHGWVTAHLTKTNAPLDLLRGWIDESFRAVAPKKLVEQLDGAPTRPAGSRPSASPGTAKPSRPSRGRGTR